tara:strand:- start:1148 stop:1345 length:198 start_codon:yes stop_codon:yes gene_type:complete
MEELVWKHSIQESQHCLGFGESLLDDLLATTLVAQQPEPYRHTEDMLSQDTMLYKLCIVEEVDAP